MNTNQLKEAVRQDKSAKQQFRGVFPSDLLPKEVTIYPSAYIANVDPSSKAGSHWVAFYFTKDKKGEFFDSYGQSPELYTDIFKDFLQDNSQEWTFNRRELQSMNSRVCGQYCVFYVILRCRGNSMEAVVRRFSNKKQLNDGFVDAFVNKYFPFSLAEDSRVIRPKQVSIPQKRV